MDATLLKEHIAKTAGIPLKNLSDFEILRRSIDARSSTVYYNLKIRIYSGETKPDAASKSFLPKAIGSRSVIIVGAGPAGLFAALRLLEHGIKPIIIERGKDVRSRRRDLAAMNKEGIVNPESNYCFGEGGAGTYSDGKLYTRSSKRGSIERILNLFVEFGADEDIKFDAHPHIGTNKLPLIITSMRNAIIEAGGEVLFENKFTDFEMDGDAIKSITVSGNKMKANAYILATGHSARDIFELFATKNITIEAKHFALGVRVEHPQSLINSIQYHCTTKPDTLPPASYSLVEQIQSKGMFSFCMCPGGIIAPAATAPGEIVVNGWSPSKRNNPHANSGIVVEVTLEDACEVLKDANPNDPLLLLKYQKMVETAAFIAGGGNLVAPAQRMVDFCEGKVSATLPDNSYLPGLNSVDLKSVLPKKIHQVLRNGFPVFGKKMRGYYTNDAIVVATESRTSSPVKIPRDATSLTHPQLKNLYPCGEGAGYAGGIVSAAMDGERVANSLIGKLNLD